MSHDLDHAEAAAECNVIAQRLGERFARTIMATSVFNELEPEQMKELVRHCIADLHQHLTERGACTHDADAASQAVLAALVREGARISRSMTLDHGHA